MRISTLKRPTSTFSLLPSNLLHLNLATSPSPLRRTCRQKISPGLPSDALDHVVDHGHIPDHVSSWLIPA
jgi:hypothetical protein